ncbi:MAG: chromosome partitioning protein [Actinomycetota bacterium]|jgi:chromosome partitioning protein|nr:chromosome partitioning protein [Actinomycetota bacterium]MEA2486859.1 chromosome partitioning protein [Actinomycetota bacterium]
MARVIAFANQKGGVAKTTTTLSIGVALAEQGKRVLAIDLDPQGALTYSMGVDPDEIEETVNDVLIRRLPIEKVIVSREVDLVPANIDLAGAEAVLLAKTGREYALERALRDITGHYDYIVIDCPPSLGILTINGLTAAQEVIIPLQCEALSHRGVGQLIETLVDIRHFTNPHLEITGVIPTMYDGRSRHAREVLADVGTRYGIRVLEPPVKKSIRFAEATQAGRSLLSFAPTHPGAEAYRAIARVIDNGEAA